MVEPPTVTSTGKEEYMPTSMVEVLGTIWVRRLEYLAIMPDHGVHLLILHAGDEGGVACHQKAAGGGQFCHGEAFAGQRGGHSSRCRRC